MTRSPADWQLPAGVSRGVWDYVHDEFLACAYDDALHGSPLLRSDVAFVAEHCAPPGRLLDVGCGTGRLLVTLAQRGYWCVGVDLSAAMLRCALAKAAAAQVDIACVQANIVELDSLAAESFDYAACLFSTLGMVAGAEHRRRVVEHCYRVLRPGGRLVLHVHNHWFNVWSPAGRRWLLRCAFTRRASQPMPTHQGIAGLALYHFTRREAVALLRSVGFRVRVVQAVSAEGLLRRPWWLGGLRAYGYLLLAERPE